MAVTTHTLTVTPKMATDWLNRCNTHNRPLKNAKVDEYADQIRRGLWQLNGEAIIFSKTETLLDGQHRLYACIEAGKPFKTVVVEGVSEEAFATIDTGVKRTAADVLHIAGVKTDASRLAVAANWVIRYRTGMMGRNLSIPRADTLQFVQSNPELAEWVSLCKSKGWTSTYAAPLAAVMFIAAHKLPDKAREFITGFTTGENLSSKSPILVLRNRLGTEKHLPKVQRIALIVMAWNAFAQGRELGKLQSPRADTFPTIIGAKK